MRYTEEYWNDVKKVIKNIPALCEVFNKKILITGASGLIGSAVTDILLYLNKEKCNIDIYLAGRNREAVIERFKGFIEGIDYLFVEYDATKDLKFDIELDYIIHGAGNANPNLYVLEPVETMLGNIIGLKNLLEFAVVKKIQRVLFISSSEVYGNGDEKSKKSYCEGDYGYVDILNSRACYPSAKRASETLCVTFAEEYGIDTVIVRPGHIYGPSITRKDTRASAQFTWNVVDGKNIVMKSAGEQLRSYCYSLDCATAIITVLIKGESKNAYNISNPTSITSIRNVAETLAAIGGTNVIFERPQDVEKKGYNMMNNSSLDSSKLEALGWIPCFDLKTGLTRTISCLK